MLRVHNKLIVFQMMYNSISDYRLKQLTDLAGKTCRSVVIHFTSISFFEGWTHIDSYETVGTVDMQYDLLSVKDCNRNLGKRLSGPAAISGRGFNEFFSTSCTKKKTTMQH